MGSDRHYAEEAPVRRVAVVAFWMDRFRSQTNGSGGSPMRPATSPWPGVRRTLRTTLPTKPDLLVPRVHGCVRPALGIRLTSRTTTTGGPICAYGYVPTANWRHPRGSASTIRGL